MEIITKVMPMEMVMVTKILVIKMGKAMEKIIKEMLMEMPMETLIKEI